MHATRLLAALVSCAYAAPVETTFGGSKPPPEQGWMATSVHLILERSLQILYLSFDGFALRRGRLHSEIAEFNMGFDSQEGCGLQQRAAQWFPSLRSCPPGVVRALEDKGVCLASRSSPRGLWRQLTSRGIDRGTQRVPILSFL
jgi:hypothetical protein